MTLVIVLSVPENEVSMKNRKSQHAFLFLIFFRISKDWNLAEREQLDLLNLKSAKVLRDFESGKKIPPEELFRRIGYLMNIHQALKVILPDAHAANTWIRRRNSAHMFSGKPAIELMTSDNDGIRKVRDYLMSQCS